MGFECQACGKTLSDERGTFGHVKFTDGDGHGEKNEVPDNWTDLFPSLEPDGGDNDGSDEPDDDPDTSDGGTDESVIGGVLKALDTDIMDLLR